MLILEALLLRNEIEVIGLAFELLKELEVAFKMEKAKFDQIKQLVLIIIQKAYFHLKNC